MGPILKAIDEKITNLYKNKAHEELSWRRMRTIERSKLIWRNYVIIYRYDMMYLFQLGIEIFQVDTLLMSTIN